MTDLRREILQANSQLQSILTAHKAGLFVLRPRE
jgi:hypothetical protein